jgi:polysaccharide export outer membrane protein
MNQKNLLPKIYVWLSISLLSIPSAWAQNPVTLIEEKNETATPQAAQGEQIQPAGQQPAQVQAAPEQNLIQEESEITQENLEKMMVNQGIPLTPGNMDIVSATNYTLGPLDVIEVDVMRHPEVSGQFIINNEGKIQYDFVGDVPVAGMTKKEVGDVLTKKLADYIISPEVTVRILGYNSKVVYVIGEVGRPGKIYMQGDTMTVREALVQAGLPLLSAKTRKTKLITPAADAKPRTIGVDVYKLLYEGDLRENLVMRPGDTLYIPPTFLAKTLRAVQPVAQPIGEAAGAGRNVMAPGF